MSQITCTAILQPHSIVSLDCGPDPSPDGTLPYRASLVQVRNNKIVEAFLDCGEMQFQSGDLLHLHVEDRQGGIVGVGVWAFRRGFIFRDRFKKRYGVGVLLLPRYEY